MIQKIEYVIKHNVIIQRLYVILGSYFFRFIGLFVKPNGHRIIFQSMIGKTFGDSPKVLFDRIKEDPEFKDYQFIWAFTEPEKFYVEGAKKVKLNSFSFFIETLRSNIWITNVDMQRGLNYKPKKTIYLNTWHGVPIKIIGNSQKTRNDYNYYDVDMMCCSSQFEKEIFIKDFNVKKEAIVQCGMPRNDELYSITNQDIQKYRKEFNIPEGKKVILYCPTWRDSIDGGSKFQIAPPINIDYWQEKLSNDYVMLFRMHHLTTEMLGVKYNNFARDVTKEPQINKLLAIADVLISDYSATIFDYCILERPIISFAYDYEEYSANRGFYEKLEDVIPGRVFKTEQKVIEHILNMDYLSECKKTESIKHRYINVNGHATEACVNFIKEQIHIEREK